MTGAFPRFHPAALEEAEAATDWYAKRSRRAAEMFLDALDCALEDAIRHPAQYPVNEFGTRRIVLRGFPFLLVFREAPYGLEIIAVAHGRRRPGYWRDRVE